MSFFLHPLKGTLSREKVILIGGNRILLNTSGSRKTCYLTRPEVAICTIAGFSTGSDSASDALLYHAPIRIKVFDFHRIREKEQRIEIAKNAQSLVSARFHESPLSATADPENDRFHAVSKGRKQLSWLPGASISVAHGVVSKDGHLGSKRGGTSLQSTLVGWTSKKPGSSFRPVT